jgi:hypothetical protein
MSTGTLALIIFAALLAQVAAFVLVGLYRRNKEYKELESCLSESQAVSEQEGAFCRGYA